MPDKVAGSDSPPDCILTEEGVSFRLWLLPRSLETLSRTASQGDMFSPDPGEFRRAQGSLEGPTVRYFGGNSLPVRAGFPASL